MKPSEDPGSAGRGAAEADRGSAGAAGRGTAGRVALLALAGAGVLGIAATALVKAGSAPAVASSGTFAQGPYLQALGPTGVTVKVGLASPAPARVDVFPEGAPGGPQVASQADAEARTFHTIRIDGLAPATAYAYRVSSGAKIETGRFTTAPPPGEGRPFRFLVYGDSRSRPEAHAAVVRAMEAAPSDFLVNTGDMVSMGNNPRDWSELFSIEGRMLRDRCVFVTVGNHELARGDPAGAAAFLHHFGGETDSGTPERLYSTFRWSSTRFFLLNAMDTWTGDERAWLYAELDRAAHEPGLAHRIAVMHWGPWSSGYHGNNPNLANGEVVDRMRDRGVELILAGHDHVYERGEGHGLKYLISGGAGAPLYEKKFDPPETRRFVATHHFIEVAIDGDHVSTTARLPGGGVLEACGYQGKGSWDCDTKR